MTGKHLFACQSQRPLSTPLPVLVCNFEHRQLKLFDWLHMPQPEYLPPTAVGFKRPITPFLSSLWWDHLWTNRDNEVSSPNGAQCFASADDKFRLKHRKFVAPWCPFGALRIRPCIVPQDNSESKLNFDETSPAQGICETSQLIAGPGPLNFDREANNSSTSSQLEAGKHVLLRLTVLNPKA